MTSNLTYKGLSTYSQLVGLRKPDTLKNQTCRTFDMIGDIPPLFLIRVQEGMQLVLAMILHVDL